MDSRAFVHSCGLLNVGLQAQKLICPQKQDSAITKELCILALTKIYCMTHPYQTLVREVTTPTLPTFVTSCLNLILSKSSGKNFDVPSSLIEAIFCSFATLLPRHTTIYRPEVSRIRLATKPYLAPTLSDGFVPSSLRESARRLVVLLHLTAPKNAGGEEWGKAVRSLVKEVHVTADQVFRAVVEDWESTAGYIGEPVDFNQELAGGSDAADGLPSWTGIHAGVERLVGLLAILEGYIKSETSTPVSIPLGVVMDMVTRMLSIAIPSSSGSSGSVRLHPAVDRDERDGLWSGMPQIYVAALQLINTLADRLQEGFLPLAQGALNQLTWVFPSGRHDPSFRQQTYRLSAKTLMFIGKGLDRNQAAKLIPIVRFCCRDLQADPGSVSSGSPSGTIPSELKVTSHNGATPLQSTAGVAVDSRMENTELFGTASELLPLLISRLPQQYLDISLRALIERTAILTHNKDAMLAGTLNPFIGKDGTVMTSILPHMTREFGDDDVVEVLLRPRMPLVPSPVAKISMEEGVVGLSEDEDMVMQHQDTISEQEGPRGGAVGPGEINLDGRGDDASTESHGLGNTFSARSLARDANADSSVSRTNSPALGTALASPPSLSQPPAGPIGSTSQTHTQSLQRAEHVDTNMDEDSSDSDDGSVHLTMELDTDTDDDGAVEA